MAVFREVRRVLRKDGTLWLNYGDAYASTPPGNTAKRNPSTGKHLKRRADSTKYQQTMDSALGFTERTRSGGLASSRRISLWGCPARVAMALQADGADVGAVRAIERAMSRPSSTRYEGERFRRIGSLSDP